MIPAMFRTKHLVQEGDRFKRRANSRRVYAIDRFIDFPDHPKHVRLIAVDNSEALTIGLSALLDDSLFERIED
jgi:hypothetical protein